MLNCNNNSDWDCSLSNFASARVLSLYNTSRRSIRSNGECIERFSLLCASCIYRIILTYILASRESTCSWLINCVRSFSVLTPLPHTALVLVVCQSAVAPSSSLKMARSSTSSAKVLRRTAWYKLRNVPCIINRNTLYQLPAVWWNGSQCSMCAAWCHSADFQSKLRTYSSSSYFVLAKLAKDTWGRCTVEELRLLLLWQLLRFWLVVEKAPGMLSM